MGHIGARALERDRRAQKQRTFGEPAFEGGQGGLNDWSYRLFRGDHESATQEDCVDTFKTLQIRDIPFVDPVDVSNAVLFLGSEETHNGIWVIGLEALPA